jgi:SHS2 domain-containing protein
MPEISTAWLEDVTPDWLTSVDHTADTGFVVSAANLKDVFARAAWAMFSAITDLSAVLPVETERLCVEADDREALLVKWLSELNFRHLTQHRLYRAFAILRLSARRLEAEVRGERIDPARHTVYTEIKAVTYHNLRVVKTGRSWKARVILDV